MAKIHTSRIVSEYNNLPQKTKDYCKPMGKLINDSDVPWNAVIAYYFTLSEAVQRRTLYAGLVNVHGCDKDLAWKAIDGADMYRNDFKDYFKCIFGKKFPAQLDTLLDKPTYIRNKVMHGSSFTLSEIKEATLDLIRYTKLYNEELYKIAKIEPFGSLQGVIKNKQPLSKSTSQWMLKGMGFSAV